MSDARIAIHGGAGVIDPESFGDDREARYRRALEDIVVSGWNLLRSGASALDAAEHAVRLLEECEYFNAGRGCVLNADGVAEMDAAVMDGAGRRCGAVAAVQLTRNPVCLARRVMEASEHVLLAGPNADRFGAEHDVEQVSRDFFVTEDRRQQLASAAAAGRVSLDHDEKYGTVGAVARDREGHLAAATSTGGMTNKVPGRVGDSPLIGAGTWADDATCAVSGTGHGEFFIRSMLGYDVHCRMAYRGSSLEEASRDALESVARMGGSGGLIAVDREGHIALPFNSPGMYRAWIGADGSPHVAIYRDDDLDT
ncbi:MAG: isoaspartyl peptidase/L-asparaginase [Xanthomonadales bacterium]|nr:isoaspartyl peptidase/L-asparaginase [Xanthomonadales bacterium]